MLADSSGKFEVKDLPLIEGENIIFAKTVSRDTESASSNQQIVVLDRTAPRITIISPVTGIQSETNTIEIVGTTEPDATITINGMQAIVNAITGDFTQEFVLQEGDNSFTVVATDKAGNTSNVVVTVEYNIPVAPPETNNNDTNE